MLRRERGRDGGKGEICPCVVVRIHVLLNDSLPFFSSWPPKRYCRFYLGRRSEDDARQISRFNQVMGPTGRFRTNLMNQIIRKNTRWDDVNVSPVIRQTLQHWGYRLTEVGHASTQLPLPFFPVAVQRAAYYTPPQPFKITMSNPHCCINSLISACSGVCMRLFSPPPVLYSSTLPQADFKAHCKKKGYKVPG